MLRRTQPDLPRPFRMPLVPLLPALSALVSLVLMLGLPWATWERLIIWMAIGDRVLLRVRLRRSRCEAGYDSRRPRALLDDQAALHVAAAIVSERLQ